MNRKPLSGTVGGIAGSGGIPLGICREIQIFHNRFPGNFSLFLQHFRLPGCIEGREDSSVFTVQRLSGLCQKIRKQTAARKMDTRRERKQKGEQMMRKRLAGVILASALAGASVFALGGCTAESALNVRTVGSDSEVDSTLTVSAESSVKVVPDKAEIVFGVTTTETDAAVAEAENSEKVDAVLAALAGLSIDESNISTSGYSMDPVYDYDQTDEEGNPKLTGYKVSTTLSVTGLEIDQAGSVITECVAAGVNDVQSVSFLASNYDEAYQQALAQAVADCRTKADIIAEASGMKVDKATNIDEGYQDLSAKYVNSGTTASYLRVASDESSSRSFSAGELEITASVTIDYLLTEQ